MPPLGAGKWGGCSGTLSSLQGLRTHHMRLGVTRKKCTSVFTRVWGAWVSLWSELSGYKASVQLQLVLAHPWWAAVLGTVPGPCPNPAA